MTARDALSQAAFEAKYRRASDPWQFAASPYEQRRYAITLRSLCRERYSRAFEPGCSVGVLSAALAERCDWLLASDFAPTAVRLAQERCANLPNVHIEQADIAKSIPTGPFDLIVFSEIGYYFDGLTLSSMAARLMTVLQGGGEFIAVHWRGRSEDHVLHGDKVHAILKEVLQEHCTWLKGEHYPEFLLDVWRRR